MSQRYGQVDWESADVGSNNFLKLEQGPNKVRVFTNPYQLVVHWVTDSSGQNRKIKCAVENCPLCRKGVKSQNRWFVGVLDRKSGAPKVLEISSQIYIGIKNLVVDPDWGPVKNYDINIKRNPKNSNPLYTVNGVPNGKPLTEEENKTISDFLAKVDFDKYVKPSTPEEISKELGDLDSKPEKPKDEGFMGKSEEGSTGSEVDASAFDFGDSEL